MDGSYDSVICVVVFKLDSSFRLAARWSSYINGFFKFEHFAHS
jgi:hypothetical protein